MKRTPLFIPWCRSPLLFLAACVLANSLSAADPILPDLRITPGVYRKNLSKYKICHTKWGLDKRHVTLSMKKKVFIVYGILYSRHSEFEVDHLISRELGGADVVEIFGRRATSHSRGTRIAKIDSKTIFTNLSVVTKLRCQKRVEKFLMIGQSLIANTSAGPRNDKRVPDYLFANVRRHVIKR